MIGIPLIDPYNGCFIAFQQPFSVCLNGKPIKVKIFIYKLIYLDHFTIEKSINFESEKIIYCLISHKIFKEWFK